MAVGRGQRPPPADTARLGVWQAEAQGRAAVEVAEAVAWRDVRCEGDAGPQSGVEREQGVP